MKRSAITVVLILTIIAAAIAFAWAAEQEKWPGVDEAVVKKFAKEAGREAREPFIEGDMLLFAFLVAGAAGGFIGGYFFRGLFPPRKEREKNV